MAIAIAGVPAPNFLAVSAIEIPISLHSRWAILPLNADTSFRRHPPPSSSSLTLASLHILRPAPTVVI